MERDSFLSGASELEDFFQAEPSTSFSTLVAAVIARVDVMAACARTATSRTNFFDSYATTNEKMEIVFLLQRLLEPLDPHALLKLILHNAPSGVKNLEEIPSGVR